MILSSINIFSDFIKTVNSALIVASPEKPKKCRAHMCKIIWRKSFTMACILYALDWANVEYKYRCC